MREYWTNIPISGYEKYEVSSHGRVRKENKILRVYLSRNYPAVRLYKSKCKEKEFRIHRLVALAFIPKISGKNWVNHKDGNKHNNHVENLEWCTPSENQLHSWKNGMSKFTDNMKKAVTKTILKEVEKQKKVVVCYKNGVIINRYDSLCEAARQINGSQAHISDCCRGKRKHHKGYSWAYA